MSRAFDLSIEKSIHILYKMNAILQTGSTISLSASSKFKKTSLRTISYQEIYDVGTENQDFNIMLNDRSFFQFTEAIEDEEIRLAFYPNPYKFIEYKSHKTEALELLNAHEISDDEYDQLISEEFLTADIPVIRYDLSLSQYCEKYHPAAHLHIGFFSENRWPVRKRLTPLSFLYMILMHYYPKLWKDIGDCGTSKPNSLDEEYRKEVVSCKNLDLSFFTNLESERLFFG